MSKQNSKTLSNQPSILNFFAKTTPQRNALSTNSTLTNNANETSSSAKQPKFSLLDLVWARLESYPHWPGLVCKHPNGSFFKKIKSIEYLNIQFFDNPPQRAWISVDDCIPMIDGKHPKKSEHTESLRNAIAWALEALQMPKDQRSTLVLELNSDESDEEMNQSNSELSPLNKSSRIIGKRKYESDSDQEVQSTLKKKKKNFIIDSDSGEDDYKPSKFEIEDESSTDGSIAMSEEISDLVSMDDEDELLDDLAITPVKKRQAASNKKSKSKKSNSKSLDKENTGGIPGTRTFSHEGLEFLKPHKIKDKQGRRPDHPDYDPKTLYVPPDFMRSQTETQQQWWQIKQDHFDTILFFKMGKFYETYHQDAVITCEITNIIFMKGKDAHAGFPEKAYERFADKLIERGYKVARIEQTETNEARAKRCKAGKKEAKCVRREVCRITSKGTKSLNENASCADDPYLSYLLAITERELENQIVTGLCFVDTSVGKFHIGQLIDDKYSTLLRTIFAHYPPVEILLEKDHINSQTLQTIKSCLPNVQITYLRTDTEFWKTRDTMKMLIEGPYFKQETEDNEMVTKIPNKLQELLDPSDNLNLTVKQEFESAIKAMGAVIYQLKRNLIEEELLSKKDFNIFDATNFLLKSNREKNDYMVLDSVTIKNLELFENSIGGTEGTLLQIIDTCKTKFGKRRLRKWICSPLCSKKEIEDRSSAVRELMNLSSINDLQQDLKKLPDLERILLKIHTQSLPNRSKNHPDSRAVIMDPAFGKARILEFVKLIESFKHCDRFIGELRNLIEQSNSDPRSQFLQRLTTYKEEGGIFPNTISTLQYFDKSFDQRIAKDQGVVQPKKGVNKRYENADEEVKKVHHQLDKHLKELSMKFGEKLVYIGNGKNRYQIEIPIRLEKRVDSSFEKTSERKNFNRYQDSFVKPSLIRLKEWETEKEEAMKESWRVILHAFMDSSDDWMNMIKIIAVIDCLISLANYANSLKSFGTFCFPTILEESENQKNVIRYKDALHPSLTKIVDNFMANDLVLEDQLMLLTGANMSGKSTLMRQTGLLTLLAHIGSVVPAEQFECTLVDRIFTRLGATDRILEGESTFYVELSETSTIIKHATNKSLVLLDELGRGTSSIDGTSIACSVVDYLSAKIRCPTMFSTHYSTLVEEFKLSKDVIFAHMACIVENEDFKDPTNETITFLYKIVSGICPKSFGFNAAKLAGVPDHVIRTGFEKANQLEISMETIKLLTKLVSDNLTISEAKLLIDHLIC